MWVCEGEVGRMVSMVGCDICAPQISVPQLNSSILTSEAIIALSIETETEGGESVTRKVLINPPVWMFQSLIVLSALADTRDVPSNEKVRALTDQVCPEITDIWIPVTASRIIILPD